MSFESGSTRVRSVVTPPSTYGLISRFRVLVGTRRPTSVPADEILRIPRNVVNERGTWVRYDHSFFQRTTRRRLMPQVCSASGWYRSDLKGIAISIVQPPSKIAVFTSHTVFQSVFGGPSSVIWLSARPPIGLA